MVVSTVEGTASAGFIPPDDSEAAALMLEIDAGLLGDRDQVEAELDLMMAEIRRFWQKEPDEVMQCCAAFGARLTEMAMLLVRVEGRVREYRSLRTQQVQRLNDEIDRQYKIASRLLESRRQDIDLTRSGR